MKVKFLRDTDTAFFEFPDAIAESTRDLNENRGLTVEFGQTRFIQANAVPRQSIMACLLSVLASLLPLQGQGNPLASRDQDYPEGVVCGAIREPMAFWSWSRMAGKAHPARADQFANTHPAQHHTRDDRILKGYHVASSPPDTEIRGSVLVAQGNAMLADQLQASPIRALAKTLQSWLEPIVGMWRFTKNNGITEGFQTKMEMMSRRAYGFRNFENYRLRVLTHCGWDGIINRV